MAATNFNVHCFNTMSWATESISTCKFLCIFYQTVTKLQTFALINLFDASKNTDQVSFNSVHPHYVHVGVHECNLYLKKQECQLLLGCADRTAYIPRPPSDFGSRKEIFHSDCSPIHATVTLLYRILA